MTRTKIVRVAPKCYKFCGMAVSQKNQRSMAVTGVQGNKDDFLVEERDYRAGIKGLRRELKMKT